jgi:hypothetical protein
MRWNGWRPCCSTCRSGPPTHGGSARELQHLAVDRRELRIRDLPRFLRVFQIQRVGPGAWVRQRTEDVLPLRAPLACP